MANTVLAHAYFECEQELIVFAKDEGIAYFSNHLGQSSVSLVRVAADAGDVLWEIFQFPNLLRLHGVDVLHAASNAIPISWRGPKVAFVHDLLSETRPDLFTKREIESYIRYLKLISIYADSIIFLSESIYERFHKRFPNCSASLSVIPSSNPPEDSAWPEKNFADFSERFGIVKPYALHMGGVSERENVGRLLKAYSMACKSESVSATLLMVGADDCTSASAIQSIANLGIGNLVRRIKSIPLNHYSAMFRNADIFLCIPTDDICPAPAMRAAAEGVPALVSDLPEFRRMFQGSATCFVDPFNVDAIAEGIRTTLNHRHAHKPRRSGSSISKQSVQARMAVFSNARTRFEDDQQ